LKILYYDCFAGISGDMHLGAMIDLGIDPELLKSELKKLAVYGYNIEISQESRKGISGTRVNVNIDHSAHNDNLHHHHNTYRKIKEMIENSTLNEKVKNLSIEIFRRIALAEAKIHGRELDEVHFHEVGAVDSIVDIVGAAICIDILNPDFIYASAPELGGGMIVCQHGKYPVPAPATIEILRDIPIRSGGVNYEATTPTGAAILAACVSQFGHVEDMSVSKTGYGIGFKDGEIPNVLRVYIADKPDNVSKGSNVNCELIECNIDDMNPEFYDFIFDSLFTAGAKDVFITPIIMKKSRPAVKLSVICDAYTEEKIIDILFKETSTLGVRKSPAEKIMLDRHISEIETRYGKIPIKSSFLNGKLIKSKPEYDDCARLAREAGVPVSIVYNEAQLISGIKYDQ